MKSRADQQKERAMEGFARHGISAVVAGKSVHLTKPDATKVIFEVLKKYHLSPRQTMQLQTIIMDVARGKKVLYIAPRRAGAETFFKAAKEILEALRLPVANLTRS